MAIFVAVRLRPLLVSEPGPPCFTVTDNVVSVAGDYPDKKKSDFVFDYVMDSVDSSRSGYVSQERCYEIMGRRLVHHSISGYHACLFCYGQTGSGKTFSIMGKPRSEAEQGLLPRLLRDLFTEVERLRSGGQVLQVQCRAQMLEIYNEKVRDLLGDEKTPKSPEIHVHPRLGVYVDGATDIQILSLEHLQKLLEHGHSRATVAATARNAQSSRGHTIFRFAVEKHEEDHTVVTSEIFCVDLAGRENEKTTKVSGENFIELTYINRSLMWLAHCIHALGRGARQRSNSEESDTTNRARFRNSKLTLLLSNALTGNSKTSLLATLSPASVNLDESYATLNFASAVKGIKVFAKRVSKVDKDALIQSLSEELRSLKERLNSATPRIAQDLDSQAEFIHNMMESYKDRWEEAQKNADLLRKQKEDALQNLAISRWRFARATLRCERLEDSPCQGSEQDWAGQTSQLQLPNSSQSDALTRESASALEMPPSCEHTVPEHAQNDSVPPNLHPAVAESGAWLQQWHSPTTADSLSWPPVPSIVVYSQDPSFSGRLVFHAEVTGRQYILGCSSRCHFRLPQAPGICPEACVIWQDERRLFLKPMGIILLPSAAIEVNGTRLVRAEARELKHQDFVVIGHSFRFFVFTRPDPTVRALLFGGREADGGATLASDRLIRGLLGERASSPLEMERARRYLRALQEDMLSSSFSTDDFLRSAATVRSMVNEATAISQTLKPHHGLCYELLTVSPLLSLQDSGIPDLCVRLLRSTPVKQEVALWSFNTFENRLKQMRHAYACRARHQTSPMYAKDDPWPELSLQESAVNGSLRIPASFVTASQQTIVRKVPAACNVQTLPASKSSHPMISPMCASPRTSR
mmetsp:Transcript_62884/g.147546  ORF Transcript_62884/g.147546 Transcript_62884/m.147546 type:complete len:866 (+) Transcript_62884:45-2642(+)